MGSRNDFPEYYVAICPDLPIIERVAAYKQELRQVLHKKYGSYKAQAHTSIFGFDAHINSLLPWEELFKIFALQQSSQTLIFNSFKWFNGGQTIYLAPDEPSRAWLVELMRDFYQTLSVGAGADIDFKPHITIGRQIPVEYRSKAIKLFSNREVSLSFLCDNIALRKFDLGIGQYRVIERYYFGNKSKKIIVNKELFDI